nr:hypothetical protein [Desulfonatronum thioautotrophicum]
MNKKSLTEADIRTKFVTPSFVGPDGGKWDPMTQIQEEYHFTVYRNILADQTRTNDFKPFGQAMTKITNRVVDKAFEI